MISKLPRWVWLGGSLLAVIAGLINSVAFLSFQHQGVTHLTGVTTQLGVSLVALQLKQAFHLASVIFSFLFGAILSGFIIQDNILKLGRRYGLCLLIESFLLFISVPFLKHNQFIGAYLASCACGLQNGMASSYSGAVLRTTHVSGFITDMGILIGQAIRKIKIDTKRLFLCNIIVFSFFIGSLLGTLFYSYLGYETLYFPAAITGLAGIIYILLFSPTFQN